MLIESATAKEGVLAPAERNIVWSPHTNDGTMRSAGARIIELDAIIYKHLASLERKGFQSYERRRTNQKVY
jgi:hypothetical protein